MRIAAAAGLPIEALLPEIQAAFVAGNRLLIEAAPGAGKTTTVPLALLDQPWLQGQQIWMLEPRRLAAQAAARRLASNLGEAEVGGTVGLVTRDERRHSSRARIVVLTEGVLTQRLQRDPELEGVGCVLFDEFHERSLQADLGLALCREVQSTLRPELRLGLMSATLGGENLAQAFEAPLISSPGRGFPLSIQHRPLSLEQALDGGLRRLLAEILAAPGGSVLVFLPGEAEIRKAAASLHGLQRPVHPLYARLAPAQQQAALVGPERRVILATAVAETSLTIAGVDCVVDAGWARYVEADPAAGYGRLVTRRVSTAQATQRAGRAGRTGPGQVWRLWSDEELLAAALPPDLRRADLSRLALELARWGSADLPWIDPPHPPLLDQARQSLQTLGLLDARHALTPLGRAVARWPLEPRWALLLQRAAEMSDEQEKAHLLRLLTLLSAEQPLPNEPVDLEELLLAWEAGRLGAEARQGLDRNLKRLQRLLRSESPHPAQERPALEALIEAFADRIAQNRGGAGRFRLSGGGGASVPERHALAHTPFLLVLDIAGGREGRIRRALPLAEADLRRGLGERIVQRSTYALDPASGRVQGRREERLGELQLSSQPLPQPSAEACAAALLEALRGEAWERLQWPEELLQLQARVAWLRARGVDLPACDGPSLQAEIDHWLGPFLSSCQSLSAVSQVLAEGLAYRLGAGMSQVQRLAPAHVDCAGQRHRLDYRPDPGPVLSIRVQQLFGLAQGPRVLDAQEAVCLHLLSPARRPLAVTSDLASFWKQAWPEVRKQMRGRYPKHPWPEDPVSASPPAPRAPRT